MKKRMYTLIVLVSVIILIAIALLMNQNNQSSMTEFIRVVDKSNENDNYVITLNNQSGETLNITVDKYEIWSDIEVGENYTISYNHENVLTSIYPEGYKGRIE
ncbi:hypothetical protein [Paenibacillus sp. 1P07SE]|uniref:hypothetical protein n=1 Tax=Paenibacillus sp. 1P07SE TaxID=3132209 RepID=UPI0039A6F3ED